MPTGPGAGGQQTINPASTGGSFYEQWEAGETPEGNPYAAPGWDVPFSEAGEAGSAYYMPRPGQDLEESTFSYADPSAFTNPNAQDIYGVINWGLNNQSQMGAPQVGGAQQAIGSQMGPAQMLYGAQIAPQMLVDGAQVNTAQDMQYAQAQNELANQLFATSQGYGPSVAEQQARMGAEQAIQAQMAAAASGGGSPLALRSAMLEASRQHQAAAATGALGRSQEAMAAQQALVGLLGGARGQGQATAQTQAQLDQQALLSSQGAFNTAAQQQAQLNQQAGLSNQQIAFNQALQNATFGQQAGLANQAAQNQFTLANQQATLDQQAQNNDLYQQMLTAYMQQNQQDITNAVAYQQLIGQEQLGLLQTNAGMEGASQSITSGLASAGMAAGGAMLAMSDERAKTDIASGAAALRAFLDEWDAESEES